MSEVDVRVDDSRECPQLTLDGLCFDGYKTRSICPHSFANRLKCSGNVNRCKKQLERSNDKA